MYNNQPTTNYSSAPQPPQPELLVTNACRMNDGLHELNDRLRDMREALFGEGENLPGAVAGTRNTTATVLSLAGHLRELQGSLDEAFGQVSSIQNRI